jgi:hypothetical protein
MIKGFFIGVLFIAFNLMIAFCSSTLRQVAAWSMIGTR